MEHMVLLVGAATHAEERSIVSDSTAEIYLLIAIFAIGKQKSVLAKQHRMHFVTSDEIAKSDRSRL